MTLTAYRGLTATNALLLVTDHLLCDSTTATGCARCSMPTSIFCCDIHHPEHFSTITMTPAAKDKQTCRSTLKDYNRTSRDYELRNELRRWRAIKASVVFGLAHFANIGGSLVLPNEMLDRVVDCVHFDKIQSIADLKQQVQWSEADIYGEEIMTIVRKYAVVAKQGTGAFFLTTKCPVYDCNFSGATTHR